MPRAKKKEDAENQEPDVFDEAILAQEGDRARAEQAAELVHTVAESTRMDDEPGSGHADKVKPKKYTPAPDPFGAEGIKAGSNRVHLLQSRADHAWIVRFDKNPSEGTDPDGKPYGKDNKHPVIAYLKSEGLRYGFSDADGKPGWGIPMAEGHYTYAEHMHMQQVTRKAAQMIGQEKEVPIPD